MVDTSAAVQADFNDFIQRLENKQELERPVAMLVYSELCPPCVKAKAAFAALADEGFRTHADFYQIPETRLATLQLGCKVDRVPSYLFYDRKGNCSLFVGVSAERLKNSLLALFPDVVSEPSPPA